MNLCTTVLELKLGRPLEILFWLPCIVTGGSEPQEDGRIARARIADPTVYTRYTNDGMMVFVLEGTVLATGGRQR